MGLKVTTEPVALPLHLDQVKLNLRETGTGSDLDIEGMLAAAVQVAEVTRDSALVCRTFELVLEDFPGDDDAWLNIPVTPLVSVSSITYVDTAGATQTLAASNYIVDTSSRKGRVALAYSESWPDVREIINPVTVELVAGYLAPVTSVSSGDDTLTVAGRTFTNGDKVRLSVSGGATKAVDTALALLTDYFVVGVSGSDIQLEATVGGGFISLNADSVGQVYVGLLPPDVERAILLLINHYWLNREAVVVGTTAMALPLGVEALLSSDRVYQYG